MNPSMNCGPSTWSTLTLHQARGPNNCKIGLIYFPQYGLGMIFIITSFSPCANWP